MADRRGFTLVEMIVALAVAGILMGLAARMLTATRRQRDAFESQKTALIEAGNLMESLMARKWESITPELTRALPLAAAAQSQLADAHVEVEIQPLGAPRPAKRVTIRLRWRAGNGQFVQPTRLTAWAFRGGERGTGALIDTPKR